MAALRLYSIGIDEVRDLVGATPATAEQARADAAALFTAPAQRPHRLARLFAGRRRTAEPTDAGRPTADDLETVLSGDYSTPERARPCWQVLEHLVACRAWGRLVLDFNQRALADFDFELARAGVSGEAGLAHVVDSDARIGLCPAPGLHVGHLQHARVRRAAAALADLEIDGSDAAAIKALRDFVGKYAAWAAEATAADRPEPDLLAFHDTV